MKMAKRSALPLLLLCPTINAFATVGSVAHLIPVQRSFGRPLFAAASSASSKEEDDDIYLVIEKVSSFDGGPIIRPYKPNREWLWRRWSGTVLKEVLPSVAFNMCATLVLIVALRKVCGGDWAIGLKPDASNPLISRLSVFDKCWKYLVTLTTFTMTFFVGEAFALWKRIYSVGRGIQGRLNDISMLLATHAARDENGKYTAEAQLLLDNVAMNIRSFHVLLWANCSRDYNALSTPQGLNLMVQRGLMTQTQATTLMQLDLPRSQLHNPVLEWIIIQVQEARRNCVLVGGDGLESVFLEKCCVLRGTYASIGDILDGRMPLAYVHLVQLLVDTLLFTAPFALYAELGVFSVLAVGLLTFFYNGLVDLAKVLLDPLDNEDYCEGVVKIDLSVLIRESNAGSIRWKNGAAILPF